MKRKISKLTALLIVVSMLVSLTGLVLLTGCSDDGDAILVGVILPLSGSEAAYGTDMLNSYKLAVEEINAAGGVKIGAGETRSLKLYEQDDGADANMATQAAAKITSRGVDFVVGGYASGAIIPTLQQFYDEDLLLLISAANSTNITRAGFNQSFMINSPGSFAVVTLMELLKSLGSQRVALIHQGDDYTKNLSDMCSEELPKNGFEVVTVEVMEKGAADVSAIVTAIRSSNADFVYWCGYHSDGSNVIKQLRRGGYEGHIAVGDGSADPDLIEACGEDGEGVYVTSPPYVKLAGEKGAKFFNDYSAKYNREPGNYATLAYDTIYLLKAAIESAASTETAAVRGAVQDISFPGLSGNISFTPDREMAVSNFMILQIKDGDFTLIEP
ncbi:MAG: branched-chain amino acid ABC transporter substrate-binding protein [Oscillospiraceae bacterium]|nr:branched-chain amino acid ABC transporter substrate-binding protein [Oscillospiraceae bacterium]